MKKITYILLFAFIFTMPIISGSSLNAQTKRRRTTKSTKIRKVSSNSGASSSSSSSKYQTGPRGGCYYINGNGNKTYVDRSLCN